MGGDVAAGSFICPMCLHIRPVEVATEGHYPAETAPAVRHRTALQCADCNHRIGGTYESAGVEFLRFVRTVTMARTSGVGPSLTRQAIVRNDEGAVAIEFVHRSKRHRERRSRATLAQMERVLEGVSEPRELAVSISRPSDEAAKRATLAWSYLCLFDYVGYGYAASPGAVLARELILDPALPLPESVMFTKGSIGSTLADPEPILVVRRGDDGATTEVIALGVLWDRLVVVFPFGNDYDDRAWRRLSQLQVFDELRSTAWIRLRSLHESMRDEIAASLAIVEGDVRREATVELPAIQIRALAAGVSPRRIDPKAGGPWRTPMQVEHEFVTREGEPPPELRPPRRAVEPETTVPQRHTRSPDRVRHWRARFAALGGGFLPMLVGQLLDDIPGIPRPIPEMPPVSMEQTPEGWIATLHFSPINTRAFGATPADAVAAVLAKAELEFSPVSA
jgi:hypothetical protein